MTKGGCQEGLVLSAELNLAVFEPAPITVGLTTLQAVSEEVYGKRQADPIWRR
jgi:hypothetical protein